MKHIHIHVGSKDGKAKDAKQEELDQVRKVVSILQSAQPVLEKLKDSDSKNIRMGVAVASDDLRQVISFIKSIK